MWDQSQAKRLLTAFTLSFLLAVVPALGQSVPGESPWSRHFAEPGLGVGCRAMTSGNGQLYCANGYDSSVPGTTYLLAVWDGSVWRREGPGSFSSAAGDRLNAIAVVGTDVYLGGVFIVEDAAGQPVHNLARWDGEAWHAVGAGVNGAVYALAWSGSGYLYVGGQFTEAGGLDVRNIARWDGGSWSALSEQGGATNGTSGRVMAIEVGNDAVYVGGRFATAGGVNANYVARWNPTTSAWSNLGVGVQSWVEDMAIGGDGYLYVGGVFETAGGDPANRIARWDGSVWTALGNGSAGTVWRVERMPNGDIVASGDFSTDAGPDAGAVAVWDGAQWNALASGDHRVNTPPFDIATVGSNLYVALAPFFVDGLRTNGVARWDGTTWSGLGEGLGIANPTVGARIVQALAVVDGDLYAGGGFALAGPDSIASLARWDGGDWHRLGDGLARTGSEPEVLALVADESRLYAGGRFTHVGGQAAGSVASWDGSTWSVLDGGVGPEFAFVRALAVIGGSLYVTGNFEEAGGQPVKSITRWDGSAWTALGGGLGGDGYALTTVGSDLYVGGNLFYANGASGDEGAFEVDNLARWDGDVWHDVGSGLDGPVYALATDGANLYVGGHFGTAGGDVSASNIAMWDGTTWSTLGSGVDGPVRSLFVNGDDVYVGGEFVTAGGTTVNGLARWDGTGWAGLDAGVFPASLVQARGVYALQGSDDGLYVGGTFGFAGDRNSLNMALWTDFNLQPVGVEWRPGVPQQFALHPSYPNPFSARTTIPFDVEASTHVRLTVYDVLGREVARLVDEPYAPGRYTASFDARRLPAGIYFYAIEAGGYRSTRKMVLVE